MEQEIEIQDTLDVTYQEEDLDKSIDPIDTEIKPSIVSIKDSILNDDGFHFDVEMVEADNSDTESLDEDTVEIETIPTSVPKGQYIYINDELVVKSSDFKDSDEHKCLVCNSKISKKFAIKDIYESKSSSSQSVIADVIHELVLKDYTEDFKFKRTTLCKRCFGLIDRAELLDQQIKLNKSELQKIQNELRTNLTEGNQINDSDNEDSLKIKSEPNETFDCMICYEGGFTSKENLQKHLNGNHRNRYIISCCICSKDIPGDVGNYLCHMKSEHPHLKPEDGLTIIKYKSERQKVKKVRRARVKTEATTNMLLSNLKEECDSDLESGKIYKLLCPLCDVAIADEEFLKHICENLADKDSYECDYCLEFFFDKNTYFKHMFDTHKDVLHSEALDKVKKSRMVYKLIENESNVEKGSMVTCPICYKNMKSSSFRNHYYRIHKKERPFQCEFCTYKAFRQYDLAYHMESKHDVKRPVSFKDSNIDGRLLTTCKDCDVVVRKKSMHIHVKRFHRKYNCPICFEEFMGKRNMISHKRKKHGLSGDQTDFKVNCPVCGVSIRKRTLSIHMNDMHTKEKEYKCTICAETFDKYTLLRTHRRSVHFVGASNNKKHKCAFCDAAFTHPCQVRMHVKIAHENKRDLQCDVCGEYFFRISALNSHKRIHTGFKPFICKVCNKAFRRSSECRKHVKGVHKIVIKGRLNNPFTAHLLPITKIELQPEVEIHTTI